MDGRTVDGQDDLNAGAPTGRGYEARLPAVLARRIAIIGLDPITAPVAAAAASLSGKTVAPNVTARASDDKRAMQMVFQNPDSALNRSWSVRRILLRSVQKLTGISGEAANDRVEKLAAELRLAGSGSTGDVHDDARLLYALYKDDRVSELSIVRAMTVCYAGWSVERLARMLPDVRLRLPLRSKFAAYVNMRVKLNFWARSLQL